MIDGRRVHVQYLEDMTEHGTFVPDGFIHAKGLCDSEGFGQTNHYRSEHYPYHTNKRLVCGTPPITIKISLWLQNVVMLKSSAQRSRIKWREKETGCEQYYVRSRFEVIIQV